MPEHLGLKRLRSVRVRMTVAATLVVAVTVTLASFAIVRTVHHRLVVEIDKQSQTRVNAVAGQLASGIPPDVLALALPAPASGFVKVLDKQGNVLKSAGASLIDQDVLMQYALPPGRTAVATVDGSDGTFNVRYTQVPTEQGALTVVVGSPLDSVRRSISTLEGALWVGMPLLIALVALMAWTVTGRALRPVESIRAEVEAISGGTLHKRVPEPRTGDEVSRLAHTMNAMLDRLEEAATRQRQFVSDASHELRSPVTTIRAQLEVALTDPEGADWPAVARQALAEEARLEALVTDLLLLASTDEQQRLAGAAPVDLTALVTEEASRPRRVPVTVNTTGDTIAVWGRADHLGRVVVNVLDNASRYAAQAVHVSLGRKGAEVHLTIDDDGPGIPVGERDRVFERFTRLDASRTRAQRGGAGLGLALARSVVEHHHGSIAVGDSPYRGARLSIVLPALGP